MDKGKVLLEAKRVGDDWRQSVYYDEAEAAIERQWNDLIWPMIKGGDFETVIDLAAGHGRNSRKLKEISQKIYIVDINEENIDFCRKRFAGDPMFRFVLNDGCSLRGIGDGEASFLYCFDAMVHFDSDVVRAYMSEFVRVLKPGSLGFCHHSNYTGNPGGHLHDSPHWRNFMSCEVFAHYCAKEGLEILDQRVLDWGEPDLDCFSLFRRN